MTPLYRRLAFLLLGKLWLQPLFEFLHLVALKGMFFGYGSLVGLSGEQKAFKSFLASNAAVESVVIFDVGANVGEYTDMVMAVCRQAEKPYRVYAFEPSDTAFNQLSQRFQGVTDVSVQNCGISDHVGTQELFADVAGSGLGSLYNRDLRTVGGAMHAQGAVAVTTLDHFCHTRRIDHIDWLKLDIEGSEFNALKGASQLLAQGKIDWIQFEFGGTAIDARIYLKDFFILLEGRYELYRVVANGLRKVKRYEERWEIFLTSNFVAKRKR